MRRVHVEADRRGSTSDSGRGTHRPRVQRPLNAPRVLVVDDNATTRKLFRITLEAEGFEVLEAESGAQALALGTDTSIALVLLDWRLPDTSGPIVCRKLLEVSPALTIVAVTGWAQVDESTIAATGFAEILINPVSPARLVEV